MSYNKIIHVRKSTPLYLTVQFLLLLFIAGKDLESENVDRKDMMLPGKQLQLLQDVVSISESCFHSNSLSLHVPVLFSTCGTCTRSVACIFCYRSLI